MTMDFHDHFSKARRSSEKSAMRRVAAVGPYEFLLRFKKEWKGGKMDPDNIAKWAHAFGYSVPAGSKPFETSNYAGDVAMAVMEIDDILHDRSNAYKTPEKQKWAIDYDIKKVNDSLIDALEDLFPFRRMRSEEADKAWIENPKMRRKPYQKLKMRSQVAELVRLAKGLVSMDSREWRSEFPNALRLKLRNDIYREFESVRRKMQQDGRHDPDIARAADLMLKAMNTFTDLNAQLARVEEALY